ncbi:unnamed protein product [Acanthoscelides obtectus]|uniref:Uncharacterized protein n=1 Tax=Acanthoscelides obtectus TaxID=200917 RepID=A0A9P0K0A2_ACAOB|nr:unnamed protein product [Acanthoscelides obtectus]CAK1648895.1 Protein CHROMATIN REMODELING 20 [Acanthoscelides obtectus]
MNLPKECHRVSLRPRKRLRKVTKNQILNDSDETIVPKTTDSPISEASANHNGHLIDEPTGEMPPSVNETNEEPEEENEKSGIRDSEETIAPETVDSPKSDASSSQETTHRSPQHNPADEQAIQPNVIISPNDRRKEKILKHSNTKNTENGEEIALHSQIETDILSLDLDQDVSSVDNAINVESTLEEQTHILPDAADIQGNNIDDHRSQNKKIWEEGTEKRNMCEDGDHMEDVESEIQEKNNEKEPSDEDVLDIDDYTILQDDNIKESLKASLLDDIIIIDDSSNESGLENGKEPDPDHVPAGVRINEKKEDDLKDDVEDSATEGILKKDFETHAVEEYTSAEEKDDQEHLVNKILVKEKDNDSQIDETSQKGENECTSGNPDDIEVNGEIIIGNQPRKHTCEASGDTGIEKGISSQSEEIPDAETVSRDVNETSNEAMTDESNTPTADNEKASFNASQQNKENITDFDSDITCIKDSHSTLNPQDQQNSTVIVSHVKAVEKIVSDSRPDGNVSDCDSFICDEQSSGGNALETEDDSQHSDQRVGLEDIVNGESTTSDIQEESVPECDIDTDSESTQLVDIVLEEILDTTVTSAKDCADSYDSETEVCVKVEPNDHDADLEDTDELEERESKGKQDGASFLGDELLELFREVEMSKQGVDEHAYAKNTEKVEEDSEDALSDYESDDAEAIFKNMVDDSSDTSDSESIDEGALSSILDDSDVDLIEEKPSDPLLKEFVQTEISYLKQDFMMALKLKEKKMNRCYVRLERLDLAASSKTCQNKANQDDAVDRLCDLTTLDKKLNSNDSKEQSSPRHRKKRKKGQTSDLSEDLLDSSSSSSDSDVKAWNSRGSSPELNSDAEERLDSMLARAVMKRMGDDSMDSDSEQSDREEEVKKKGKQGYKEAKEIPQKEMPEEEKAKKKWRNDKLLREKIDSTDSSDSSTSSSSSRSSRKKMRKGNRKSKYEDDDPDYKLDFNESSDEEKKKTRMSLKEEKSNKSDTSDDSSVEQINLDDTTDNDSDVEFVFKDEEASSSLELTSSQKGHRRNIRALMSDADLEVATLRAKEAEEERIGRLKTKQKLRESFSQCLSQSFSGTGITTDGEEDSGVRGEEEIPIDEGLVLDVDEKTNKALVQVLTLIHTLFAYKDTGTKHALVVCPLSTVSNWKKEVRLRFKDIQKNFEVFTIGSTQEIGIIKQKGIIKQWYCAKRSILIMGYERYECLTNEEKLNKLAADFKSLVINALVNPGPDLIVCDEGHLLKSKKAVKVQALNKVRTKRRIVLTGTPLQNNLIEYYYMVQFVKPNLLGNLKEFKTNFVNPITNGQYIDSTKEDIKLMKKRTHVLHNYLKQTIQRFEDTELQTYLKKMHHYAVFVQLHPVQVEFYRKFLEVVFTAQMEQGKAYTHKGFLSDYGIFRYICTHPYLLKIVAEKPKKSDKEQDVIITYEDGVTCKDVGKWWKDYMPTDAENTIEYGTKLLVVKHILEECEEIGDKVLIFSQSLGELDLIEHFLKKCGTSKCPSWKKGIDYTRMDGTCKPESRSEICDRFNNKSNTKLRLLLISIRVGGLGLNLTAANRVITMTVSWNPSYDLQSVFRVYRFGQEKAVYVYRLIALDTMEEKAYQRTVTKLAVAHRVIDKYQIKRHYKSDDLQAMYECYPTADKQRPTPSVPEDEVLAKLLLKLPVIYKFHEQQALLANRPEDDLNEQEKIAAWEEFEKEKNAQKAAKEAAALAATFAKEAAVASAEAMTAFAATTKDFMNTGGAVPITSPGPTFSTAYSLCPPSSSGTTIEPNHQPTNYQGHVDGVNRGSGQNVAEGSAPLTSSQAYNFPPSSRSSVDLANNLNGKQVDVNKNTLQANGVIMNPTPEVQKFNKALKQFFQQSAKNVLNNTLQQTRQRRQLDGALQQNTNKQPQIVSPWHPKRVDETPIDLTNDKSQRRNATDAAPKDPLSIASSEGGGTANVPPQNWYNASMKWMDQQKANLVERLNNQNQKENQQVARSKNILSKRPLMTYSRSNDKDLVSMDHAYSAASNAVKRKNDDHTNGSTAAKKKKRVLRMNPCALLQPASKQAVATASRVTTAAPTATVVDLSEDEVEVVEPHDDIIHTLNRSGITVTRAPSKKKKSSNDVITLD